MKKFIVIIFLSSIMWGIPACNNTVSTPQPTDSEFHNLRWTLIAFEAIGDTVISVWDNTSVRLQFYVNGDAETQLSCNTCYGSISLDGKTISLFELGACTEIACLDDHPNQYQDAIDALEGASRYELSGDTMFIYYQEEMSRLVFLKNYGISE